MIIRFPATRTFAACLLLAAITSVPAIVAPSSSYGARLPLSLAFALFVPGYLFVTSLFPTEEGLGHLARFGLSLACSFPLIIVLTIVLSASPFERSPDAQIVLTDVLVLLLALAATYRQRQTLADARLIYVLSSGDGSIWRDPFAIIALLLAVGLAAASIASVVGANHEQATSLSIPSGGTPANPIQATQVTVDIHSHEQKTKMFQVVVSWQGQVLGKTASFPLQPDQRQEEQITTTPPPGQGTAPVDVMLFEQGSTTPYRQLTVWMRTVPFRSPS
jgi:uncharacterized membrane protein